MPTTSEVIAYMVVDERAETTRGWTIKAHPIPDSEAAARGAKSFGGTRVHLDGSPVKETELYVDGDTPRRAQLLIRVDAGDAEIFKPGAVLEVAFKEALLDPDFA